MKVADYETVVYPIDVFLIQNWASIVLDRPLRSKELREFAERLQTDLESHIENALSEALEEFNEKKHIKN